MLNRKAFTLIELVVGLFLFSIFSFLLISFLQNLKQTRTGQIELMLAMDLLKRDIMYSLPKDRNLELLTFLIDDNQCVQWKIKNNKIFRYINEKASVVGKGQVVVATGVRDGVELLLSCEINTEKSFVRLRNL